MDGKYSVQVSQGDLMFGSGGRRHGKFSVANLVTVAVVGQETVVVIGENDLTRGDVWRQIGRHGADLSYQISTKQVVAT